MDLEELKAHAEDLRRQLARANASAIETQRALRSWRARNPNKNTLLSLAVGAVAGFLLGVLL